MFAHMGKFGQYWFENRLDAHGSLETKWGFQLYDPFLILPNQTLKLLRLLIIRVSQISGSVVNSPNSSAFTVNSRPAASTTTPVVVCQNTTPLSLATGVTTAANVRWYPNVTTGTGSTVAPSPPTTSTGSTTYYVSQIDGNGCESARASIDKRVNGYPAAPLVSPASLTYCQNALAVPLSATSLFYIDAVGGTPYAMLTPSTNAGNNYYVSQTLNNCEGP